MQPVRTIFADLMMWRDLNGNGVAVTPEEIAAELTPLSDFNIYSIRTVPLTGFEESDRHGNSIKYKGVVAFKQGALPKTMIRRGIVFDLWFAYKAPPAE